MMNKYTLIDKETPWTELKPGLRRKLIHTENLMTVVVEFYDGPASQADPFHHHPHEQASYIAEGELILYIEGVGEKKLVQGDMFAIPSNIPHTVKTLTPVVRIIDSFNPIREEFIDHMSE